MPEAGSYSSAICSEMGLPIASTVRLNPPAARTTQAITNVKLADISHQRTSDDNGKLARLLTCEL